MTVNQRKRTGAKKSIFKDLEAGRFFLFFGQYWSFFPQALMVAWQVLYYLSHSLALFALIIFQIGPHAFFPGLALHYDPPTYVSCITGIIDVLHQAQLFC
jgi:hypothetical protein